MARPLGIRRASLHCAVGCCHEEVPTTSLSEIVPQIPYWPLKKNMVADNGVILSVRVMPFSLFERCSSLNLVLIWVASCVPMSGCIEEYSNCCSAIVRDPSVLLFEAGEPSAPTRRLRMEPRQGPVQKWPYCVGDGPLRG